MLKEKSGSHVMKIKLEFLRDNDKAFWKFKSYIGERVVLLQIDSQNSCVQFFEWWYYYDPGSSKFSEREKHAVSKDRMKLLLHLKKEERCFVYSLKKNDEIDKYIFLNISRLILVYKTHKFAFFILSTNMMVNINQ